MATKATKKPSKAAAAKKEKESAERTVEWQGHTFILPAELPKSLMFRIVELEEAENDPAPTLKLLRKLIGDTQYGVIVREIESSKDEEKAIVDAFGLLSEIFEQYGTSEGESEASQDS
jgi:hypothetical protein